MKLTTESNTLETTAETPVDAHDSSATGLATPPEGSEEHTHDHTPPQPTINPALMREVSVEVDADTVSKAFRSVVKKYQKLARIPGFRVGKVPETVIKNRFGKDVRQEVLDELVSARFREALVEDQLSPVSEPQIMDLFLVEGQPLRFKAAFEVLPTIDITGYDTVTVDKPSTELTDAEFQAELARVMDSHGTVEPMEEDRPMVDGDWAEIEFTGIIQPLAQVVGEENESAEEPIKGEDVLIEVGGANTLPAFTEALRGAKPGQEMDFEVSYPADFGEPRLAGQTVKYDLKVKAVKTKTFPDQDDDFAKQLGDYESWSDFETQLREHAAGRKKQQVQNAAKDKMLGDLIGRYQFPVPETFVQQQIDARLDRGLRVLQQQGMSVEDMRKLDFNRLRAVQRDQAVAEVKASLILDSIAKAENVEVDEDELERELLMASLQSREPLETLRERMVQDGSFQRMRDQMRREKAGTLLYERLAGITAAA
jgi:trigger factor